MHTENSLNLPTTCLITVSFLTFGNAIDLDLIRMDAAVTGSVQREDSHPCWSVDLLALHLVIAIGPTCHFYTGFTIPSPV